MTPEPTNVKLPFWPFFVASALLLALAAALFKLAHQPVEPFEMGGIILCTLSASASFLIPFLRRNTDGKALAQADSLATSLSQIHKIEHLASQISSATAQWQSVQGSATQVADFSKDLASSMAKEAKNFAEFMQKANDSEKAHLRLEVEKLRRTEVEWVQILTHILDHTFALMAGAQQSGQRNVIEQIGQFQAASIDVARRVGLAPIISNPGEPFNPQIHQCAEEGVTPTPESLIKGTLVSGYTFQGQIIRRAVVAIKTAADQVPELAAQVS